MHSPLEKTSVFSKLSFEKKRFRKYSII